MAGLLDRLKPNRAQVNDAINPLMANTLMLLAAPRATRKGLLAAKKRIEEVGKAMRTPYAAGMQNPAAYRPLTEAMFDLTGGPVARGLLSAKAASPTTLSALGAKDKDKDKPSPRKVGEGKSFLDDVEREGFEGAVAKRKKFFRDTDKEKADLLAKAQDPASRVSGIKPSYGGVFGGSKTIPLDTIDSYNRGLLVSPHPKADYTPRKTLKVEDLEDATFTALPGDQSRVGVIERVVGKDIEATDVLGGGENAALGSGQGWQSAKVKMEPLEAVVKSKPEESVLGAFLSMGGAAGDFQPVTTQVLAKMAEPGALSKRDGKLIDRAIASIKNAKGEEVYGDNPGIKSEDFMPWLLNMSNTRRAGFLKALSATAKSMREYIPQGMAPYEMIPGFDIPAARHAITEPSLINKTMHPTDPSLGLLNYFNPNASLKPSSQIDVPHSAFDQALAGGRLGTLDKQYEFPMSLLFDDYIKQRREAGAVGSDFSPLAQNMINRGVKEPQSVMTPEKIERFNRYMNIWNKR